MSVAGEGLFYAWWHRVRSLPHLLGQLLLAWGMAACSHTGATPAQTATQQRVQLRMQLAAGYLQNGQPAVALEEVGQALAADPRHAPAHNLQGLILLQQGDRTAAERSFRRAVALDSHDTDARHNLGVLLCEQEAYDASAHEFARVLAEQAGAAASRTHLAAGRCALQAGRPELAASHARSANTLQASAASLWLGMQAEHRLGHHAAVSAYATRLQQLFPESAEMQRYERKAWND